MRFYDNTIKSPLVAGCALSVAALALSGCMSSPTYGTDKTATQQLVSDATNILALGPSERPNIEYKPRPGLVKPTKGEAENLPAPQESVASIDNPAWVESPEQKRARLRAEADENSDDPNWTPQIDADVGRAQARANGGNDSSIQRNHRASPQIIGLQDSKAESAAFRKRLAQSKQGDPNTRRYLSEPPVDYRQTAENAPVGDIGEDELKKERRLKAAASKKNGNKWGNLWPF